MSPDLRTYLHSAMQIVRHAARLVTSNVQLQASLSVNVYEFSFAISRVTDWVE